jgi:hypothetical protein
LSRRILPNGRFSRLNPRIHPRYQPDSAGQKFPQGFTIKQSRLIKRGAPFLLKL